MAAESVWTDAIRDMVEAGPVSWDRLVSEVSVLVPPGRAYRSAMRDVNNARKVRGHAERNYTDEQAIKEKRIRYGARGIVTQTLNSLKQRGRIEIFENGTGRMVRLGPHPWSDPKPLNVQATPWGNAALAEIASGPVGYDDLFERVVHTIPRERAIDKGKRTRERNRARRGYQGTGVVEFTDEQNFRVGARLLYSASLSNLAASQRVVVSGTGANRMVSRGSQWIDPGGA